jgi:small-conductance mechanosensitive channel
MRPPQIATAEPVAPFRDGIIRTADSMPSALPNWLTISVTHGLRILIIIVIALVMIRILRAFTRRLVKLSKTQTRVAHLREQQTRTMAGVLNSIGVVLIISAAILTILPEFGFNVTPIEAFAAVASLALGFGAQTLIKDIINGFFIIFEDQFGVGDMIQVNQETGRVENVTLRRTVMRNLNGALITVPNSLIGQVANLSRDWLQTFVDVTIPGDQSTDAALSLLEKVAADLRGDATWSPALVEGPRVLGIESLSLDGTVLRLQVRTVLNRRDDVARELRRRIRMAFEESNIPLGTTHRVFWQGQPSPPPSQ